MPNSRAGDLMPGGSADPNEEHPLPAAFMDLPDAGARLRSHGVRGKRITNAHLETYGPGSAFYGSAWLLDTNLGERALVLAELPARDEVRMVSASGSDESAENLIHVNVVGLRNNKGQAFCVLFTSADGFPLDFDKAAATTTSEISDMRAGCEFREDPGQYAILVFHDEALSNKPTPGARGIPREGIAMSNNPAPAGALPKFGAAAFPFRGGRLDLTVKVVYR